MGKKLNNSFLSIKKPIDLGKLRVKGKNRGQFTLGQAHMGIFS